MQCECDWCNWNRAIRVVIASAAMIAIIFDDRHLPLSGGVLLVDRYELVVRYREC
jgi:hypothetical protein